MHQMTDYSINPSKRVTHKMILLSLFLLTIAACGHSQPQPPVDTVPTDTVAVTDSLSLDEAIGQLLLVGFRGTEIDSNSHIWRDIKEYHVGSVILFDYDVPTGQRGRNIKNPMQVKSLCQQLRALNPDLLIGIDQEGGNVMRLSSRYGFPRIASPQRSAQIGADTVRHYARLTAATLHEMGINLNFAPVADVNVNPHCPVIGAMQRSFSDDETLVRQCCDIWIEEQAAQGVISCMKHFPGHGSARGDTHKGLVDVSDTWQHRELEPYRHLPSNTMVMTAHVIDRQMDPAGLPASLSPVITAYLRDTLDFQGVIITDDLAMGAIAGQYSFEQTLRMALQAGADILCLSNNGSHYDPNLVPKAVLTIKKMVDSGTLTEDRIQSSAQRIRALYNNIHK
jgi:beta-N-acetylhexosaminidase